MKLKWVLRLLATAVALALFAHYLGRNVALAQVRQLHPHWLLFAASWVVLQASFMLSVGAFRFSFHWIGARIDWLAAYCVFFISNLGRYVPGRVWQMMIVAVYAKRRGISVLASSSISVFCQAAALGCGILFVLVFGKWLAPSAGVLPYALILPLAPFALIFAAPRPVMFCLNKLLQLLHRRAEPVLINYELTSKLLAYYFGVQLLNGLSFLLLIRSLGLPLADPWFLLALYPIAYIIGYVSLVTPGGIGIRESFMLYLLKQLYAPGDAGVIALASLVWFSGLELLNGLISLLVFRAEIGPLAGAPAAGAAER